MYTRFTTLMVEEHTNVLVQKLYFLDLNGISHQIQLGKGRIAVVRLRTIFVHAVLWNTINSFNSIHD